MHVQKAEEEDPDLVLVKVEDVEPGTGSRRQSGLSIQEGELLIDTTTRESPLCCVTIIHVEEAPHIHGHVLHLNPTDLKSTAA